MEVSIPNLNQHCCLYLSLSPEVVQTAVAKTPDALPVIVQKCIYFKGSINQGISFFSLFCPVY
jgi:hypothetical protein